MNATTVLATTNTDTTSREKERDSTLVFGFWMYILTDAVLFGSLFAVFAVLRHNNAGAPPLSSLLHPTYALIETIFLLTSSFLCGLGWMAAVIQRKNLTFIAFSATIGCGLTFVVLEFFDFRGLVIQGDSWTRNGALSGYFTLLGTHGLHVLFGLLWLTVVLIRVWKSSLTKQMMKKLALFSIFWHFIDIIWIFIFSIVFLVGGASG